MPQLAPGASLDIPEGSSRVTITNSSNAAGSCTLTQQTGALPMSIAAGQTKTAVLDGSPADILNTGHVTLTITLS